MFDGSSSESRNHRSSEKGSKVGRNGFAGYSFASDKPAMLLDPGYPDFNEASH